MKIAYIGNVTLQRLETVAQFDRPLPTVRWGFPLGSEIIIGLLKRGHEIHVIRDHLVDKVEHYHAVSGSTQGAFPLHVHLVPCQKRTRWSYFSLFHKEVRAIRAKINEVKPDVVFAQWTYYHAYSSITSGYPTLVVAHDSPWRVFRMQPSIMTLIRAIYASVFVIPQIRNLTAVSPHMVAEYRKFRRLRTFYIPVIPNGVTAGDESSKFVVTESHLQKGTVWTKTERPTILMVTQWGKLKNSTSMLRAFAMIHRAYSNWRMIVYGNFMDEKGAIPWMTANGIGLDGFELRGLATRAEIDRVLEDEADLFVSPSLEESFGMVFVEAMARGVPCVGGEKSGAVPWVIGDGGETCDVTDSSKLANCVVRIMLDNGLRRQMGAAGRRRVRKMFDLEKVIEWYEAELRKIAQI